MQFFTCSLKDKNESTSIPLKILPFGKQHEKTRTNRCTSFHMNLKKKHKYFFELIISYLYRHEKKLLGFKDGRQDLFFTKPSTTSLSLSSSLSSLIFHWRSSTKSVPRLFLIVFQVGWLIDWYSRWVFSALIQTTRALRLRRNLVKLSVYKVRLFPRSLPFGVHQAAQ